ncbi:MAG: AAA family ATPase [Dehalococcoidia bacterium]
MASLYGRARERELAYSALSAAEAGAHSTVLVQGEAGAGKSSLGAHLAQQAAASGFRVFAGRAHPNVAIALLPIAQAFDEALRADGEDADAVSVRRYLSGEAPPGDLERVAPVSVSTMTALSRVIARWQSETPLLFWFDDGQWMAEAAVGVLTYLALASEAERAQRVLLVIGYRPDEATPPLRRLVRQLRRQSGTTAITLSPLDEMALFDLARERLGEPPGARLVADLREYSHGNPLLAHELLRRHIANAGGAEEPLRGGAHGWTDAAELVGERFADLPAPTRRVVTAAAFLDEDAGTDLVAAVLNSSPGDVERALALAASEGVVELADGRCRFVHPVLWQSAYIAAGESERQALHARIASVLLARRGAGAPTDELRVAGHVIRGGPAADAVQIPAGLLRRAGERAFASSDWGEAARCLSMHLDRADSPDPEARDLLAQALYRGHDVARAIEEFSRAAVTAERSEDWEGVARALLGASRARLAHRGGDVSVDSPGLERALERLGSTGDDLRARAAQVASEVHFARRDYTAAISEAERGLVLAGGTNDVVTRVQLALALGLAHWGRLDLVAAGDRFREAEQLAAASTDAWVRGWAPVRVALVEYMAGSIADARRTAEGSTVLYERSRDWSEYSLAQTGLAVTCLAAGDLAAGERHALLALSMMERSEYGWTAGIAYPALASIRALRGEWDETRDVLMAWGGRVDRPWAYWTLVRAWQGGQAYARQAIETFSGQIARLGRADLFSVGTLCAAAEVALVADDRTLAARLRPLVQDVERNGVLVPHGWTMFVPTLAARLGALADGAAAVGGFANAIDRADTGGLRLEAARARLAFAEWLLSRNQSARAAAVAEIAVSEFESMGVPRLAAVARQLLTRTPRAAPTPASPGGLSAREIEVLRGLARGLTNNEIAEELVISPATARRHVANIYLKIDVPNRAAATLFAAAHHLLDDDL